MAGELAALTDALPAVGGLIEAECRLAVVQARYVADRAIARRQGSTNAAYRAFWQRFAPLATEYRRLWLARSRYGGLEDSYGKLTAVLVC